MNPKKLAITIAMVLGVVLASQLPLSAQEPAKHHQYKLIDLGSTFGGPQSYFNPAGQTSVLNRGGTVAGFADTSLPDPFPNNFCFNADCFVSPAFQWQNGVMTDLGALRGGVSSAPIWISANGLIAGLSENGETDPLYAGLPQNRAVLWQQGKITDLGTLPGGGYQSEANAVNSAGQVVGSALNTIPDANSMAVGNYWYFELPYGYQQRAFLWDEKSGMQDLGTLGGTDAVAALINEPGQVMGWSYTSMAQTGSCFPIALGSFIWEREKGMTNVGSFGGTCTLAYDLNNRGQVVGFSLVTGDQNSRAFLWEHGSIQDLGGSLGGISTGAFAVNDAGQAAGFGYLAGESLFHATLWRQVGHITDLGTIGSDPCSSAKAINAKGQVVGDSISLSECLGEGDATRAFLWEDGAIFDLNTLIPPGSTLYLLHPETINDRGEIAGTGVDGSGNEHAFLLIPCDENHPGIEGCDYSMVDTISAAQVQPVHITQAPAASPAKLSPAEMMARIRSMRAGRNRRYGTPQTSPQ